MAGGRVGIEVLLLAHKQIAILTLGHAHTFLGVTHIQVRTPHTSLPSVHCYRFACLGMPVRLLGLAELETPEQLLELAQVSPTHLYTSMIYSEKTAHCREGTILVSGSQERQRKGTINTYVWRTTWATCIQG